jgi:formylmethanofuran dehydrogenase subunit D
MRHTEIKPVFRLLLCGILSVHTGAVMSSGVSSADDTSSLEYLIVSSAGSDGSISPSGNVRVAGGDNQTFTFTPNTGYVINTVYIDGLPDENAKAAGAYTFYNVSGAHNISVTFGLPVSVVSLGGGSVSPSASFVIPRNSSYTVLIKPDDGYKIDSVIIDGLPNEAAKATGFYTLSNVSEGHSIMVIFRLKEHRLSTSAGSDGAVAVVENILDKGSSLTCVLTPDMGCEINSVWVDGVLNEDAKATGVYTFLDIETWHSLSVTFRKLKNLITILTNSGGTVSPGYDVWVVSGATLSIAFSPDMGYMIDSIWVDGVLNEDAKATGVYTFRNIETWHSFSITFKPVQYLVSVSTSSGGTVSPNGYVWIFPDESQTFTFMPDVGCIIDSVLVDGVLNEDAEMFGSYIFSHVNENHSLSVTFKPVQYLVSTSTSSGGTVSPNGDVWILPGENQAFTFTPAAGYEMDSVLVDGILNESAKAYGSYMFSHVDKNHSLSVTFKAKPQYPFIARAGENGSIVPDGNMLVARDDNLTFIFIPDVGYEINLVFVDSVTNVEAKEQGYYIFSDVDTGHSLWVTFKLKQYTVSASTSGGGFISPAGDVLVDYGSSKNFTFMPDVGYIIENVFIDNVENTAAKAAGFHTFRNVTEPHHIMVIFNPPAPALHNGHIEVRDNVRAYPSPTQGIITVKGAGIKAGDKIEICNAAGAVVRRYSATAEETALDISPLPAGIYVVNVKGKQVKVVKID